MAMKRTNGARASELEEFLSHIKSLWQDANRVVDPTANVLRDIAAAITRQDDLRKAEFTRQDDLRKQAEYYTEKLAQERQRSEAEAKKAEAGRIDALLVANTNNVALALEKQSSQASGQDKRISALEQNQYQGVGVTMQSREGMARGQWTVDKILSIIAILVAILAVWLKVK